MSEIPFESFDGTQIKIFRVVGDPEVLEPVINDILTTKIIDGKPVQIIKFIAQSNYVAILYHVEPIAED